MALCRLGRRLLASHPGIRPFSRTSCGQESPEDKAIGFLVTIGHERHIAVGVVDALRESGMTGGALLSMVRQLAGRWEVGEDEGLEALVASVRQSLDLKAGKIGVKFWCIPPNCWASGEAQEGEEKTETIDVEKVGFQVEALEGMSITDVAKYGDGQGASVLGEYLECACSGVMACSTCQVVVDDEWFKAVGEPEEAEQDMLDLAFSPRETSRLGCQVVLTSKLEGMVLKLPRGANNMMDFIPFEG
ncbi:hypothetical protein AAMO2058_000814200 [Amorphochlora amoebiformis]